MAETNACPEDWFDIPDGWNGTKDIEYLHERFGELENYYQDTLSKIGDAYENALEILVSAYDYFNARSPSADPAYPVRSGQTLSAESLLALVLSYVVRRSTDRGYTRRFEDCAESYLIALKAHANLFRQGALGGENQWLFPLVQLHDLIASFAYDLEEAMSCEHEDFDAPLS